MKHSGPEDPVVKRKKRSTRVSERPSLIDPSKSWPDRTRKGDGKELERRALRGQEVRTAIGKKREEKELRSKVSKTLAGCGGDCAEKFIREPAPWALQRDSAIAWMKG